MKTLTPLETKLLSALKTAKDYIAKYGKPDISDTESHKQLKQISEAIEDAS